MMHVSLNMDEMQRVFECTMMHVSLNMDEMQTALISQ